MILIPVSWPNSVLCAVVLTFAMDADSLMHLEHITYWNNAKPKGQWF